MEQIYLKKQFEAALDAVKLREQARRVLSYRDVMLYLEAAEIADYQAAWYKKCARLAREFEVRV